MKIEDQVCTFEQASLLTSYGVDRRKAYFTWYLPTVKRNGGKIAPQVATFNPFDMRIFKVERLPAFTVAELGLFLPEELLGNITNMRLHQFQYCEKGFIIDYRLYYESVGNENKRIPEKILHAKTEAQVRADMLIYLLENKIVDAEFMNRRCKLIH